MHSLSPELDPALKPWAPAQVLEGAEDCLLSSSGMNAATTMLLALVPAGGHIVTTTDCYRRTRQFIQTVLPKMGITATVSLPLPPPATATCPTPAPAPLQIHRATRSKP